MALSEDSNLLLFKFSGTSMYPTLKAGDNLIVNTASKLSVGALAVFNSSGKIVTHRIVKIAGSEFFFKGDRQSYCEKVSKSKILGEVIFVIRKGRIKKPGEKSKISIFYRLSINLYIKVITYLENRKKGFLVQSNAVK